MKLLFVWTGVTSYMADCWRVLAAQPGVALRVVIERVGSGSEFDAEQVLAGLDCRLVPQGSAFSVDADFRPDVLFAVGWHSRVVREYVKALPQVPKVCCFDMPWRWLPRCIAARFVLRGWVRRFAAAYVPGNCAARYAGWLGFRRIEKGLFSIDQAKFTPGTTPRHGFFYVGRFSPEKRIDLVLEAFRRYRAAGGTWALEMYGTCAEADREKIEGLVYRGFLQPGEMAKVFGSRACLLLASSFDPWPLVILESRAAGCRVIASDRCGNADELGAHKVPYGDASAMAAAMLETERDGVPATPSDDIARYDCRSWARRTMEIAKTLAEG